MSYRTITRLLGATSLERKCRLLFGSSLLVLITVSFWWVDSIAERLVLQTTRRHAGDLVDLMMIKAHQLRFETGVYEAKPGVPTSARELLTELIEAFERGHESTQYCVVSLDDQYRMLHIDHLNPPADQEEAQILRNLEREIAAAKRQPSPAARENPVPEELAGKEIAAKIDAFLSPPRPAWLYADRRQLESNTYNFYQPVYWKPSCFNCHSNLQEGGVLSPTEGGVFYHGEPPLHVIKLTLPWKSTQQAINQARAILIAVAILTVFLAMIALYVIIRYVVVKPLQHLRDVSDQVSRGKTEVRAVIETHDEIQELAESFNRMLRHLTDAQSELQRVNRDLDGKLDQLAQLNMRLYEMNRLKSDFLATMSHELRTPLNSIIGFSEVLQRIESLDPRQKRYAQNIQKSGRALLEMINDILDLAKLEAGKMEIRLSEFTIDPIISAQCDMMRSLAEQKNIDVTVDIESGLPPVVQDQPKVQQIMTNLLSNAIKFTPEGGRVSVTVRRDERGSLELTVEDTGIGIAAEDREVIFEKFRQSSVTQGKDGLTREYSGTGLGLSIVKELCRLLDGQITFESELGKGSKFVVVLPWNATAAAAVDRTQPADSLMFQHQLHNLAGRPVGTPPAMTSR